ncbi:MAG: asparagine synthase-related protein, partial [Pseudomonadales bacterium]|nr:asparagine synthase-related protein [Pseudomonadales bacterium]
DAIVEAVKKSANASSAPLISLSGGLDSRLILAALQCTGNKAIGLSYGHPKSADVRIANELARSCKFPIFRSQQTKDSNSCGHLTWDTIQRIADLGGGELAVHHAHSLLDRSLLEQSAGRTLLTGTGAETFRAFYFDRGVPGMSVLAIPAFRKQLNARGRRYVFEEYAKTAAPLVAALPDIAEQLGSVRDRAIDNCFNLDLSIANCLNLFYLRYRLPRMVVNGQLALDQHYDRSHPFLDGDVLQQLINLPVRYHLGSGFHLRAINRLSPRLAGIDWDKTNAPLNRGLSFSARYPGLISRLGLTPRWGKANLPMFEYGPWAKTLGPSVLHRALGFLGISGQDQVKATQTLMASPNYHQTMGFCAVWFALLDKTPPHCKDNSRAIA